MVAQEQHDAPQRRLFGHAISLTHVALTALVALASSVVAILFQVAPTLRPDPRERVGADLSVFAVEPGVSLASWVERGFPRSERQRRLEAILGPQPHASELAFEGELVYVKLDVTGFKRRDVYLRHAVYNARSQERVSRDRLGGPVIPPIQIAAPSESSVKLLWIPSLTPDPLGRHFVRVELYDENGILAVADSALLVGGRASLH